LLSVSVAPVVTIYPSSADCWKERAIAVIPCDVALVGYQQSQGQSMPGR